jgi:hypothetical protein
MNVSQLQIQITGAVNFALQKGEVNFSEVVGCLEIIKMDYHARAIEASKEQRVIAVSRLPKLPPTNGETAK